MNCFRCGKRIMGTGKQWVIASRIHCYWNHVLDCKVDNIILKEFHAFIKVREQGHFDNTKLIQIYNDIVRIK